jgi:DNA-binding CsgD family transcriptional regulator/tetratricopeptide (TPR) repeat protein
VLSPKTTATDELLERVPQLETLRASLEDVRPRGPGRLVLVAGEAGVGKTTLVRHFCDDCRGRARVLWGACDALFTPRPLGPLLDIAEGVGGALEQRVAAGGILHELIGALGTELRARVPTVLVLEDLHWADEATFDVVRLLARRLDTTPALIVATYRDDELEPGHPLRIVLGDLAGWPAIERMRLEPLSAAGVAALVAGSGFEAAELHRVTGGNPFYVTEALAAGVDEIPATVRDAVLARTARLSPRARRLVEAAAIAPGDAELWLLEALAPDALDRLEESLASGMLAAGEAGVSFRHELARLAVQDSLPPPRRLTLNRQALAALAAPPGGDLDLARLAHHAEAARDRDAVLRFGPAAAARAAEQGAHREAAAQYAAALAFADDEPPELRADLLERRSDECLLIDDSSGAIAALEAALACRRERADARGEAGVLTALASVLWCPGRVGEARECVERAVALLEHEPPSHELASACAVLATLHKDAENRESTGRWGRRALGLAEDLGDDEVALHTSVTLHGAEFVAGEPGARERLEACSASAARAGSEERVSHVSASVAIAAVWLHLAWGGLRRREYARVGVDLTAGLEHVRRHGLDLHELYLVAYQSRWQLDQGCWSEALGSAAVVLRHTQVSRLPRILGLAVTGLVAARRKEAGARGLLDEALAIALPSGELQRIGPAAAARAELAWLEGDRAGVERATAEGLALGSERSVGWVVGELLAWRKRSGLDTPPAADLPDPFAAVIADDWEAAADFWDRAGCPYEAALCRGDADDEGVQRQALDELQALGATAAAAIVARRLRQRGVRGLPRGPYARTRRNPGQLTAREVEVLALVAGGLRNGEIADRLCLSRRTVDAHVSAILRKLDVRTRSHASAEAVRLGLVAEDR